MQAKRRRDAAGWGLAALNRFAGARWVQRLGLAAPAGRFMYHSSKTGFRLAGAAARQFNAVGRLVGPARLARPEHAGRFDLNPTDEQQMIVESVRRFAEERLRPATQAAEKARAVDAALRAETQDLGLALLAVPEALDGAGAERSPITSALVAEALGWGDMGQAVALLAPVGVANALAQWGSAAQQSTYLAAYAGDTPPLASLALLEPHALADPLQPRLSAKVQGDTLVLNGEKALVPLAGEAELLIVSASVEGQGARLVVVEAAAGWQVAEEPAMGLRAAGLGRIRFDDVPVPATAIVGDAQALEQAVHLARLGWCALATGAAQAVLDYVTPYVNERQAFGEPVSHRQGVAFAVANIGIELAAMRLMTWRAVSLAEQGKPFAREAVLARNFCAAKAMEIGSAGVQLLGGHGFVCEHPVERWYRDLRAAGILEGGLLL